MWLHEVGVGGLIDTVRESTLKVDFGRKIPCHTKESNLPQWHAGPMLYQFSYTHPKFSGASDFFSLMPFEYYLCYVWVCHLAAKTLPHKINNGHVHCFWCGLHVTLLHAIYVVSLMHWLLQLSVGWSPPVLGWQTSESPKQCNPSCSPYTSTRSHHSSTQTSSLVTCQSLNFL